MIEHQHQHEIVYLSRADVEAVGLPMVDVIDAVEDALRARGRGEVEMPPKPGVHPAPDAFVHAMPAYLPHIASLGIKWVSGYPENPARGLPYISGLLILNDAATGLPTAVMDCTWITAMRTGAATAVAAKYLARSDSRTVGIVACGVQGRSNLEALHCAFELASAKAYDIVPETARRFADEMEAKLDLEVSVVDSPAAAVRGSDLVVTSGPILRRPTPVIDAGWLAEGAFACPVDFDSYWTGSAFRQADVLATDDSGQLEYYRREGYFRETPQPHADLGDIIAGRHPGRTSPGERTICVNLGLALEDMATAPRILARARQHGIGTRLPL